jgi:hypothetical protein
MRINKYGSAVCAALLAMTIGSAANAAPDIAKCEDAVAKGSRNVGNQEQKKNRKCVKDAVGENVDACVDAEGAKAAIKRTKLQDLYAPGGKCDGVAAQVNPDPDDIADDTEDAAGDILRGAFGDPVDGIVPGSKCHDKIAKRAGKKFDTELKAFRACVKTNVPLTPAEVVTCVGSGVNDTKAQSTVQPKLEADMAAQCTFSSPPAGLEDGACSGCVDAPTCATCIGNIVDCQACLAMNNSNNGTADCDQLDDGVVNSSCGGPPPTATSTATATPSPTNTPPPSCPLAPGAYTLTQVVGGILTVDGLPAFPFPAGGAIIQDVAAAGPGCVHNTVVPFPGGFSAPSFCIPALGFTTSLSQTGCGIGLIDSNGGSDFTITELGDTSAPGAPCFLPPSCAAGANSNVEVDVTIGDSVADTCGSGTANATVSIPVFTTTWLRIAMCPDPDGTFDPGLGDILIVSFPQTLDFTTDTSLGDWADINPDGCCLAGAGPASVTSPCTPGGSGGLGGTGTCIDLTGIGLAGADTTTVAAGAIGSSGAPLYDLTFVSILPNEVTGPGAPLGASCATPPVVTYGGTATRCIP